MLLFNAGRHKTFRWPLIALCLLVASAGFAEERILDYQSDIRVNFDGSLMVTETIRVQAEGEKIRRGIYRDFPTSYKDRLGNHYRVGLDVQDVLRNGSPERFHTEKRANGIRIYIGSENQILDHGVHEYKLHFHTTRQIGFFEDYDELYWNVTGTGWIFPIDRVFARIELPSAVKAENLRSEIYTGYQDQTGKDATAQIRSNRAITFETTRPLAANEGLSVAVGWPKGIIAEPGMAQKISWFLNDNGAALVLILGLLAPLGWYLWAWNLYGRDPQKGVIIPRFGPPTGLSPAACNYILRMAFRMEAFSAAIVSLGVKGYLEIHEDGDDFELHLKNHKGNGRASTGEKLLLDAIFSEGTPQKLEQENYKVFMTARAGLKKALKAEHLGRVFNLNSRFALPAFVMTIVAIIIASQLEGGPAVWIPFAILTVLMHLVFLLLLKAPTPAGRKIMDEIEGFKMYLDTAEQDRLDRMQSPQLTPEVFESFLPYAFALEVENKWCERFTREFPEEMTKDKRYHPAWYTGRYTGLSTLGHFGDNFNSNFSSAISSASSPPGSSSGSGGGGSSGGGGGGGGGGGW